MRTDSPARTPFYEGISTGAFDFRDDKRDAFGLLNAKTEVSDAVAFACVASRSYEGWYVERTWPLSLKLLVIAVVLANRGDLNAHGNSADRVPQRCDTKERAFQPCRLR